MNQIIEIIVYMSIYISYISISLYWLYFTCGFKDVFDTFSHHLLPSRFWAWGMTVTGSDSHIGPELVIPSSWDLHREKPLRKNYWHRSPVIFIFIYSYVIFRLLFTQEFIVQIDWFVHALLFWHLISSLSSVSWIFRDPRLLARGGLRKHGDLSKRCQWQGTET